MNDFIRRDFISFGVHFQVAANDPETWASLGAYLPFGSQPSPEQMGPSRIYSFETEAGIYTLAADNTELTRSEEPARVLEAFESDAQLFIAEHSPVGIFVHAGVVGWKGRALVFPGRSFSGKSTLVAALLGAGATYFSDEFAILEADGRVLPYPRPLSLRQVNGESLKIDARHLGPKIGQGALPIGAIMVCRYEAGATWRPQELSPGQALLALLDNTVAARSRTQAALQTLEKVVAATPAYQGERGEAEAVIAEILKL